MIGQDRDFRVEPIPLGRIQPRQFLSRREATDEEISWLAASIRTHGLLQPILVRPAGKGFEVVCGQRRYRACKALGLGEVIAVVRPLENKQALEFSIAENVRRDGLS